MTGDDLNKTVNITNESEQLNILNQTLQGTRNKCWILLNITVLQLRIMYCKGCFDHQSMINMYVNLFVSQGIVASVLEVSSRTEMYS